jgi:hypothetical protein
MSTPGLISSLLRVFTPLLIGCDENTFALLIRNTRWRGLTHSEKYKKPKVRHNRRLMAVPAGRSVTYPTNGLDMCVCYVLRSMLRAAFWKLCVGSKRTQRLTVTTLHFQRVNGQQINESMHLFFLLARAQTFSPRPLEFSTISHWQQQKKSFPITCIIHYWDR